MMCSTHEKMTPKRPQFRVETYTALKLKWTEIDAPFGKGCHRGRKTGRGTSNGASEKFDAMIHSNLGFGD